MGAARCVCGAARRGVSDDHPDLAHSSRTSRYRRGNRSGRAQPRIPLHAARSEDGSAGSTRAAASEPEDENRSEIFETDCAAETNAAAKRNRSAAGSARSHKGDSACAGATDKLAGFAASNARSYRAAETFDVDSAGFNNAAEVRFAIAVIQYRKSIS